MSIDITITLSDDDLERFQESKNKGKLAISDTDAAQQIEEQANELIDRARVIDLPNFISPITQTASINQYGKRCRMEAV